ncbi:MAG: CopG family transcriptional regulator [Desulfurococcales archaeon]|nr:CopG family transcriptional regulator [Desulfurococcales archaeon]
MTSRLLKVDYLERMVVMAEEKVTVEIRKEVYEKARKFIEEQGGFNSVEELIEFLIEEVTSEGEGEAGLSPEDEEKVKERLRSLGYL